MAIAFARVENLKRASGDNACRTSAYISHERVVFEGTKFSNPAIFNFSDRSEVFFSAILLPKGVNEKFRDPSVLWNAAEQAEIRKNSQTAINEVVALPDDREVTDIDRQNLVLEYAHKNYVNHGLAVQVAIHKELSDDGSYHNIHAHFLGTTRRFNKEGTDLGEKARDLMPTIKKGFVVEKSERGDKWGQDQNLYFEEYGIPIRVDLKGVVPEIHLGPVRMRSRNGVDIIVENDLRKELNQLELREPKAILDKILETRSFFTQEDVFEFASKNGIADVLDAFWEQEEIVEMFDQKTHKSTGKYTSGKVIEEEKQILRLSDRIYNQRHLKIDTNKNLAKYTAKLSEEQKVAFDNIVRGKGLSLVEGHAGAGKSYLLSALNDAYKENGYTVRSFGPDSVTVGVLKENKIENPKTIHKFNFDHKHGKVKINKGREIWLVDESGKIGNRAMSEFLKIAESNKAQIVLCGSSSQLSSIERGGMFRVFNEKYGSEMLNNIQRQKTETQLKITNNLAFGRMNQAIGEIVHYGGAKFRKSKIEADKALIRQWVADRMAFPEASTVIIANSYKGINKFNECVRHQLKNEGVISLDEKLCKTFYGNVLVSVGDRIEFRQNNPDIGVTNGLNGVVTKLCENEINVQYLNENGIQKTIKFDPRNFVHYSLPYAKTYSRVQGETYDRVYVSNTSYMSLQKFYVAGTRHRYKMYLFSSDYEAKNVAELKLQVSKNEWKGSTLSYTTEKEIQKEKEKVEHIAYLNDLKNSPSVISRLAGKTYEKFGFVQSFLKASRQAAYDRSQNEEFYKYEKIDYTGRGSVLTPKDNVLLQNTKIESELVSEIINFPRPDSDRLDNRNLSSKLTSDSKQYSINQRLSWDELSKESKILLRAYFDHVEKADALGFIVKQEKMCSSSVLHEDSWKKECGVRNKFAYEVVNSIPKEILKTAVSQKCIEILNDRSLRHEAYLETIKEYKFDIEGELRQNIEPLLYKLFPDGPSKRTAKGLRFGSNGSLSVTLVGKHAGTYKDFEKGDGGGMLQLVSKTFGFDRDGAVKWSKEFLGCSREIELPKHFKNTFKEKEDSWVSLKADSKEIVPDLKNIAPYLQKNYIEDARYSYKNDKGEILFYTLRLVKKDNPFEKIVLPLSYGCYQGEENSRWKLKGYHNGEKFPLYNLPELQKNLNATVLVVEGEKTANAAQEMFKKDNICCVTWSGGAQAVSKSDWSVLVGRNVIIWPDNDKAGFKASEDVCLELRKVGAASVDLIDRKLLVKEFPEKWDLADPIPDGKSLQSIRDLMLNAQGRAVSLKSIYSMLADTEKTEMKFIDKLVVNEVVWRVDERLRQGLEEKFGSKNWEIESAIKNESIAIMNNREKIKKELEKNYHIPSEMSQRFEFFSIIHQAKTGFLPTESEVKELREFISGFPLSSFLTKDISISHELINVKEGVVAFAIDKTFVDQGTSLFGQKMNEEKLEQTVIHTAQNIIKQIESLKLQESVLKQNALEKEF